LAGDGTQPVDSSTGSACVSGQTCFNGAPYLGEDAQPVVIEGSKIPSSYAGTWSPAEQQLAIMAQPAIQGIMWATGAGIIRNFGGIAAIGRYAAVGNGALPVEGSNFLFSDYYYTRLVSSGRPAPILTAQEVFNTATSIVPDAVKSGYNVYSNGVLRMVYNPETFDVWHLGW